MRLTTNRMRQSVGAVSLATALLLLLSLLFAATSASAADETNFVPNNPKCEDLGLTMLTKWTPTPNTGWEVGDTHEQDGVTFTVEAIKDGGEITEISFVSTNYVSALIFKAGNGAMVTTYDPAVLSGSGVTVENHGASHIELCLGDAPVEDPTLVVATCVDGGILVTVTNPNDVDITVDISIDHVTPDPAPAAAPTTTDSTGVVIAANSDHGIHVFAAEDTAWSVEVAMSDAPDVVVASDSGTQDCEDPVNAPAAAIDVSCEAGGATITLDNTGSDEAVTYTVTIDGVAQDVEVLAGETDEIVSAIDEDADYAISVTADGMDDVTAEGNFNCDEPVNAPAAAVAASCDVGGATIGLDNTGSDEAVTYTVTIDGVAQDVAVAAGETDEIFSAIDEDADYAISVAAAGLDTVTTDGNFNCDEPEPAPEPEPTQSVDPTDVEKEPAPEPAPDPEPAPEPAPEAEVVPELARTGMDSTELLLLALLLSGMGLALLLIPVPSRERTF